MPRARLDPGIEVRGSARCVRRSFRSFGSHSREKPEPSDAPRAAPLRSAPERRAAGHHCAPPSIGFALRPVGRPFAWPSATDALLRCAPRSGANGPNVRTGHGPKTCSFTKFTTCTTFTRNRGGVCSSGAAPSPAEADEDDTRSRQIRAPPEGSRGATGERVRSESGARPSSDYATRSGGREAFCSFFVHGVC